MTKVIISLKGPDMKISDAHTSYTNQRSNAERLRLEKNQVENERKQFKAKISRMKEKNRKDTLELEKDYQNQIDTDDINLRRQLNQVRNRNALALQAEQDRSREEVHHLKKAHAIQVEELKDSQSAEIKRMHEEHKEVLYNSRRKFEREFAKYRV